MTIIENNKSLKMTKYGNIQNSLEFQSEQIKKLGANEVIVRVHASSINPIDLKVLKGEFKSLSKKSFPSGIGYDLSGVVCKTGVSVKTLKVGDEVYGRVGENEVGTLSEYTIAKESDLSLKPDNLNYSESASIPLVGLTAYQSLREIANLKESEKIFIHAGSGGVGSFAIQLAKSIGAYVIATTSSKNVEFVQSLGADLVIDYKTQNYLDVSPKVDVVLDTLGGNYTLDAFKVLKNGGRVVSLSGDLDDESAKSLGLNRLIRFILKQKVKPIMKAAKNKNAMYKMHLMNPNGKQLGVIRNLIEQTKIRPVIDKVYPFEQSIAALEYLSTGRVRGKVVINH